MNRIRVTPSMRSWALGSAASAWVVPELAAPGASAPAVSGRQAALKGLILRGPKLERDGCAAWRARDLRELVERRFGVRYSESGVRRLLHGLDLSWQKARPIHPEADARAQERFKKTCPA